MSKQDKGKCRGPRALKYQQRTKPNSDFCCVPQCAMSGRFNSAVSYHHFPRDEKQHKLWVHNIKRKNLIISRSTTVCSRHFVQSDVIQGGRRRLKEGAVPVLFAWNNYALPTPRPSVWERTGRQENEPEEMDVATLLQCHDYDARPEPSALDLAQEKVKAQQAEIEQLQKKLEEVSLQQSFCLERFSASDDQIRFYTRFSSYRHLQTFWKLIEPATWRLIRYDSQSAISTSKAEAPDQSTGPPRSWKPAGKNPGTDAPRRPSRCLPLIDEFFLFLVYLSLGLKEMDLANRFNIHQSTVSRLLKTWGNFLYTVLGAVGIWMSADEVRAKMPSVFGKYSDTQVVVDCTEIKCQTPSSPVLQSEVYSTYKSHTTFKALIGTSPHGAVTFVSSLYSGSVSDKELFKQCGIIPLLDKDMAVMVDKGFRIDDLVPCKVYRPPFLGGKPQLAHDEVLVTQDIARLRIHVERINRRIKENKLFDTVVPLAIAGSINQLFAVACLLCNYQNKALVKSWAKELD